MTFFQKLGKNIEKQKLEKKKVEDKYWKLQATERLHYDSKLKDIEKKYEVNLKFFTTSFIIKSLGFVILLISLAFLGNGLGINKLIIFLKPLLLSFVKIIFYTLFVDLLIFFLSIFNKKKEEINELNKRFKLC